MTPSAIEALITTGLATFGVAMLAILAAVLTLAIAYLVFKVGWRKTVYSLDTGAAASRFDRAAGYIK